MIDLQKEAEEYCTNPNHRDKSSFKFERMAYIAGATTSKYVQAEKLRAQMDILLEFNSTAAIVDRISNLQEQLKTLEQ